MIDIEELIKEEKARRDAILGEPPPIPCLGRWVHTTDGSDFDCDYEHAGHFGCEDCIVNGGRYDPRIDYEMQRDGEGGTK